MAGAGTGLTARSGNCFLSPRVGAVPPLTMFPPLTGGYSGLFLSRGGQFSPFHTQREK